MSQNTQESPDTPPPTRGRFSDLLVDSGYKPISFIGKCIAFFGYRNFLSFVLGILTGAVGLYIYTSFYDQSLIPKKEPAVIELRGQIKTLDDLPYSECFFVGTLSDIHGPFKSDEGLFNLEVPEQNEYQIVAWDSSLKKFLLLPNLPARKEENYYKISTNLRFQTGLGRMKGEVKDQHGRPVNGFVRMEGTSVPIQPDGFFELAHIPLGKVTLDIMDEERNLLKSQEIFLELNQQTPKKFFTVEID